MQKSKPLPRKKTARYPRKIGLNVDQATWEKWVDMGAADYLPADLVRNAVKKIVDKAYNKVPPDEILAAQKLRLVNP